jgi:REP element-mobilizing transposase RayT
MSRLRRIERVGRHFFITTNLIRGSAPLSAAERSQCLHYLAQTRARIRFSLFAYVVMLDHVHLLLHSLESDLPSIMRAWKSRVAGAIAKAPRKPGPIWQPRYFDFILRRAGDISSKLAYIHENPVQAGLVVRPEDWAWSSAAHYINKGGVPIEPDPLHIPVNPNESLWPGYE